MNHDGMTDMLKTVYLTKLCFVGGIIILWKKKKKNDYPKHLSDKTNTKSNEIATSDRKQFKASSFFLSFFLLLQNFFC